MAMTEFERELRGLINRHSVENDSDTPDYILARYLLACLSAFTYATRERDRWYGFKPWERLDGPLEGRDD